jgi:acyl-CoA reductase-like NAD-dependent aldehyde dehydrogenase
VRTHLFINGKSRSTTEALTVFNPARPSEVVGEAASASVVDVNDAIASAHDAWASWSTLPPQERARVMAAAVDGIAQTRDDDALLLAKEVGKIVHEAWVDLLVFEIRWNLALALVDEVDATLELSPAPGIPVSTTIEHQPLGVVTIIVPFNWPAAILAASLPHALLAGNTVIVKPPPTAPLALTQLLHRVAARLPDGVLNVVTSENANVEALIADDRIAKVCFTGSVAGGKTVMSLATRSLTRVTLELGGNDPAILLADALIDDTHLDRLFAAIFDTTGQICMNVKRIYVHESRLDELVTGLSNRLEQVLLGDPLDPKTTMGPLHSAPHKQFVEALVREARESGADVREFGTLPSNDVANGYFVRPALIINPGPSLGVVAEEQFGPVIPIISFSNESDAVAAANDTWAGLGASVWSASPQATARVASQMQAGYVWINDHGATRLDLRAPFGGMKNSGFGREQGITGVRDFQDTRAVARLIDDQSG